MIGNFSSRTEFLNTAGVFLDLAWEHPDRSIALMCMQGHLTFMIPSDLKDEVAAGIMLVAPDADIDF
jgi:hypothetical protein